MTFGATQKWCVCARRIPFECHLVDVGLIQSCLDFFQMSYLANLDLWLLYEILLGLLRKSIGPETEIDAFYTLPTTNPSKVNLAQIGF